MAAQDVVAEPESDSWSGAVPRFHVSQRLRGIVDVIAEAHFDGPSRGRILPSGKIELLLPLDGCRIDRFTIGDERIEDRGGGPSSGAPLLFGSLTRSTIVDLQGMHCILVIMNPIAACAVLGMPAAELRDTVVVDPDVLRPDYARLEDGLRTSETFEQRVRLVEDFLLARLQVPVGLEQAMGMMRLDILSPGRSDRPFETRLDLDDLSYSRSHMHRLCREWLGTTYAESIRVARAREAAYRIHSTDLEIGEIAYKLGFFDPAHLTHVFREHVGMTPSAYRAATKRMTFDTVERD
ncbi:MAG: helix-turn-helix transcriptional regulator [Actinomycetota bacterium]|nr:helix-turn-helix transcriptional regulator [Actinomycetota bacterium]